MLELKFKGGVPLSNKNKNKNKNKKREGIASESGQLKDEKSQNNQEKNSILLTQDRSIYDLEIIG